MKTKLLKLIFLVLICFFLQQKIYAQTAYIDFDIVNIEYKFVGDDAELSYELRLKAGDDYSLTNTQNGWAGMNLAIMLHSGASDAEVIANSPYQNYGLFNIIYINNPQAWNAPMAGIIYPNLPADVTSVIPLVLERSQTTNDLTSDFVTIGKGTHTIRKGISGKLPDEICLSLYVGTESGFSYGSNQGSVIPAYANGEDRWCPVIADNCPPILVWTAANNDADWQNADNWYPNEVPGSCTDVYIPGNVLVFPSLSGDKADNECDRIFFMPGAQLGQPQLLTYNEAHIQLNYGEGMYLADNGGQTKITGYVDFVALGKDNITAKERVEFGAGTAKGVSGRERWNMLSPALHSTFTGDYGFGGFPRSFIRRFDPNASNDDGSSFIKGRWSEYSSVSTYEFTAGQGFAHYVYSLADDSYSFDHIGMWTDEFKSNLRIVANNPVSIEGDAEFGLAATNGIVQLPFYADSYLRRAHRNHRYQSGTETSEFYTYTSSPSVSVNYMQYTTGYQAGARNNAYRFIAEDAARTSLDVTYNAGTIAPATEGELVLLGNPYMSALDFDAFYTANSGLIKNAYIIYNSTGSLETSTYETIAGTGNTAKIAPMQSFLVELINTHDGNLNFTFTAADMAKTDVNIMLKSNKADKTERNSLKISAENAVGTVDTYVKQSDEAHDGFCNADISKIIDYPAKSGLPEVYTLTSGENARKAVAINTVRSNDLIIPIGIVSTYSGETTFTLSGMDSYDADICFIDLNGDLQETDITGRNEFTYSFTHSPVITSGAATAMEDRFMLRISTPPTTGFDNNSSAGDLTTYVKGNDIVFVSTAGNVIEDISLYDLQGRCLYKQDNIGSLLYTAENVLRTDGTVYIAKIKTANGVKEIKIIK